MSENKALGLYRRALSAWKKKKYDKALNLLDQSISINPEDENSLKTKATLLFYLKRFEECYPTYFKWNLVRLKKLGGVPSNISSIEAWIHGAKELVKLGNEDRALDFLMQAACLSLVTEDGGYLMHHNNAKIYYEMALLNFNFEKDYRSAMLFFNKAIEIDPNLTIPEEINNSYNESLANHSGVGVEMIFPMNTNLLDLIPLKDKIVLSTKVTASASTLSVAGGIKTNVKNVWSWESYLLLTDYGIAFQGAASICKLPAYYIPWEYVDLSLQEFDSSFIIPAYAADFIYKITLNILMDPKNRAHNYLRSRNFDALVAAKLKEFLKRTVENLKSLNSIPSRRDYGKKFEYVPRGMYKEAIKIVKQDRV